MEAGAELIQPPEVKVEYAGIKPEDSIIKIDGSKLGRLMTEIGYPSNVLKPIVVNGEAALFSQNWALAEYDPELKKVRLNLVSLKNTFKELAQDIINGFGDGEKGDEQKTEKKLMQKILDKIISSKYFPPNWAYYMLKERQRPFMAGNNERRNKYFEHYKKVDDATKERMRRFMEKQVEIATKRHLAWILAHEYEHRNDFGKKRAVILSMAAGSLALGWSALSAIDKMIANLPEDLKLIGGGGVLLGMLLATAKGRSLDEQASYDAGDRNFSKFMECISIDPKIFARDVLGKEI